MDETFILDLTMKTAGALLGMVIALLVYFGRQLASKIDALGVSAQKQFDAANMANTRQISELREEMNLKFRSVGHRNVDLSTTVHDLILLFAQHTKSKDDENALLKGMLKQATKMEDPDLGEYERRKRYETKE